MRRSRPPLRSGYCPASHREHAKTRVPQSRLLRNALPLSHSQLTIYAWNIYCFDRAIGPPDFELVDTVAVPRPK